MALKELDRFNSEFQNEIIMDFAARVSCGKVKQLVIVWEDMDNEVHVSRCSPVHV